VCQRLGRVDRDEPRVRQRRAQHRAVQHPGQHDVVQVPALAADEARVLLPLDAAEADRPVGGRRGRVGRARGARAFLDGGHAGTSSVVVAAPSVAGCAAAHWIERTMVA
jgi:hypothetical protein